MTAYSPLGIFIALVFIGLPFVVRAIQPVLQDIDREVEEAAQTLGANSLQRAVFVVLPAIAPSLISGVSLAFARAVGEYGSVVFIAGKHADADRDRAAADRHQAGAVRLRRRRGDRPGDGGHLVRGR